MGIKKLTKLYWVLSPQILDNMKVKFVSLLPLYTANNSLKKRHFFSFFHLSDKDGLRSVYPCFSTGIPSILFSAALTTHLWTVDILWYLIRQNNCGKGVTLYFWGSLPFNGWCEWLSGSVLEDCKPFILIRLPATKLQQHTRLFEKWSDLLKTFLFLLLLKAISSSKKIN